MLNIEIGEHFSNRSKNFALCGNTTSCNKEPSDDEFKGDGIVPTSSQTGLIGNLSSAQQISGGTNILHIEETKQIIKIRNALSSINW